MVKKTEFLAYNTPIKADGIIAIKIRDDDELVAVRKTGGDDDIIMVARSGKAARFHESQARPMGRDTGGVRGMNVSQKGNAVLAMDVARPDQELLVVTVNGFGKRTPIPDYPLKNRGTMGVKTISMTDRKGALVGALVVREHQELVFISQTGMVQRTGVKGISRQGRPAQGVTVMNLRDDDEVSAVALVMESEADTGAPVAELPPEQGPNGQDDGGERHQHDGEAGPEREPSGRAPDPAHRWLEVMSSARAGSRRRARPRPTRNRRASCGSRRRGRRPSSSARTSARPTRSRGSPYAAAPRPGPRRGTRAGRTPSR
jgi:DNA gyrase subunit A